MYFGGSTPKSFRTVGAISIMFGELDVIAMFEKRTPGTSAGSMQ
jgi:hypothetical protein